MSLFEKLQIGSNVLVVCHDAGGAEVISAWVCHHSDYRYRFYLDGPAVTVFDRKMSRAESSESLVNLIKTSDFVLTGSGWISSLEKEAIKESKKQGVAVATCLDHWANYRDRFWYDGMLVLPDEIWVVDKYALKIAKEVFQDVRIQLIENQYILDIIEEFSSYKIEKGERESLHILYVCEPISRHLAIKASYDEFEAMELFVLQLEGLVELFGNIKVRIRAHPSEPFEKYYKYIVKSHSIEITLGKGDTLVSDCAWSDWVVGMNSMALVVALAVGKEVFCCIPGASRPNVLPYDEIQNLLELGEG